jgi:hypothetical protein
VNRPPADPAHPEESEVMNRRRLGALLTAFAVLAGLTGIVLGRDFPGVQPNSRTWGAPVSVHLGDLPTMDGRSWG